jgi:hypothetical protein
MSEQLTSKTVGKAEKKRLEREVAIAKIRTSVLKLTMGLIIDRNRFALKLGDEDKFRVSLFDIDKMIPGKNDKVSVLTQAIELLEARQQEVIKKIPQDQREIVQAEEKHVREEGRKTIMGNSHIELKKIVPPIKHEEIEELSKRIEKEQIAQLRTVIPQPALQLFRFKQASEVTPSKRESLQQRSREFYLRVLDAEKIFGRTEVFSTQRIENRVLMTREEFIRKMLEVFRSLKKEKDELASASASASTKTTRVKPLERKVQEFIAKNKRLFKDTTTYELISSQALQLIGKESSRGTFTGVSPAETETAFTRIMKDLIKTEEEMTRDSFETAEIKLQ